jgi:hypothetical protein
VRALPMTFESASQVAADLMKRNVVLETVEVTITERDSSGEPVTRLFRFGRDEVADRVNAMLAEAASAITYPSV